MYKMNGNNLIELAIFYSGKQSLFSKQEMENVLSKLKDEIENTVRGELEMFYRMSGTFIIIMNDLMNRCVYINVNV